MKRLAQGVSRLRLALKPCALVESITCCVLKAGFDRGQRDLKGLLCPGVVTRGYSSYGEIGSRAWQLGAMGNFPRPRTGASVPAPVPSLSCCRSFPCSARGGAIGTPPFSVCGYKSRLPAACWKLWICLWLGPSSTPWTLHSPWTPGRHGVDTMELLRSSVLSLAIKH